MLKEGAEKYGGYTYVNGILSKFEPQLRMPYIPTVYENQEVIQAYMSPDMKKMLVSGTCFTSERPDDRFIFVYDVENDEIIAKQKVGSSYDYHIVAYDNTHIVLRTGANVAKICSYNTGSFVEELNISGQGTPRNSKNCIGYCYHNDTYFLFAYDIESGSTSGQSLFNIVLYNKQTKTAKNNRYTASGYTSFSIGMSSIGILVLERYSSKSEVNLIRENNGEMQSFSNTFSNFYRLQLAGFVGNFAYFLGNTSSSSSKSIEKYDISGLTFSSHDVVASNFSRYFTNMATFANCFVINDFQNRDCRYYGEDTDDSYLSVKETTFSNIKNIEYATNTTSAIIKNIAGIVKEVAVCFSGQYFMIKQIDCYSGVFKKLT